jgi:hypothetical protein
MKRILLMMTLAAACVLATGTVALAKHHATKSGAVAAQPAATASCSDPSHCPFGSCPVGAKTAATATAAPAADKAATCADPAKCTTSCPQGGAGATAAVVTKR